MLKKIGCYLLIICILCTGCTNHESGAFFAWMDGYLAMGVGEEFDIALTCFFDKNQIPFNKNNVESLSFDNLDQVAISDYSITSLDTDEMLPYDGYVFNLTVNAKDKGVYRTDKLNAMIDGSSIMFPIGKWVFDVQDDVLSTEFDDIIDIMSSPVAGAGRNFVYDYKICSPNVMIKNIWISEDVLLFDDEGLPSSNEVELPEVMNAPINFIRPKVTLSIDDEEKTVLGMSYYSGSMGIQEDILDKSKAHNSAK